MMSSMAKEKGTSAGTLPSAEMVVDETRFTEKTSTPAGLDERVLSRLIEEGYGPGAWHGSDLRAALADVPAAQALWRPQPERHNIAEIALHHAWCVRNVRAQLAGATAEPFVLEGEDWFELSDESRLSWTQVQAVLAREQGALATLIAALAAGRAPSPVDAAPDASPAGTSPVDAAQRFDLALGLTCHAVYHAGQVQLIKVLHASR